MLFITYLNKGLLFMIEAMIRFEKGFVLWNRN